MLRLHKGGGAAAGRVRQPRGIFPGEAVRADARRIVGGWGEEMPLLARHQPSPAISRSSFLHATLKSLIGSS